MVRIRLQKRFLLILVCLVAGHLSACAPKGRLILPTTPPSERNENPGADAPPVSDPVCEDPELCFEEGLNRWKDGDRDYARLIMSNLQHRFQGTRWAARASFIRGKWAAEIGSPFADHYLLDDEAKIPALDPYALYFSARGHFIGERYEQAGTTLNLFFERHPKSVLAPEAALLRAEIYISKGECGEAVRGLDTLPLRLKKKVSNPAILLLKAECAERNFEYAETVRFLQKIWFYHSGSPQAEFAQTRLEDLKGNGIYIAEPHFEARRNRAEWLLRAGRYRDAQGAFSDLAGESPKAESHSFRIKEGEALFRLREYDQAVRLFESVAAKSEASKEVKKALFWLGRVAVRQGSENRLVEIEKRLADNHPLSASRARVIYYIADLLEDRGDRIGARRFFLSILDNFPPGRVSKDAAWRLGWMAYKDGDSEEAIRRFRHFVDRNPSDPESGQYLYWIGRSAENAGRKDEALRAFTRACGLKLHSYYCQRGSNRFTDEGSFSVAPAALSPEIQFSEAPLFRIALSFSVASEGINGFSVSPGDRDFGPSLTAQPLFNAATELIAMKMFPEAGKELVQLGKMRRWNSQSILFLSELFDRIGDPYQSLRLIRLYYSDLISNGGAGVPDRFWRLAFPSSTVIETLGQYPVEGMDPYLVSAVIREESAFNAKVISRAGAIGLMQLMPFTARDVARDLGLGPIQPEDLKNPVLNIRLGSRYLRDLIDRFEGNWILAVAAYNAGPEAVSRWVSGGSEDPEEFIESIPYRETRNYTKRVIRSYYEYKRISNDSSSFFPLDSSSFFP